MEYEDQVLTSLQDLNPGARVNLNNLNDPDRFRSAVIYLMDGGWLDMNQYVFNRDYTILKKHEKFDFGQYKTKLKKMKSHEKIRNKRTEKN